MGLATFGRLISAILLLCLTLRGCDCLGRPPFDATKALGQARDVAAGHLGPDVQIFNVLDYGGKGDANKDNYFAFMDAFRAACFSTGNAMMVIPDGNFILPKPVEFTGPCSTTSPLIFQVNGNVTASSDFNRYGGIGGKYSDWIEFRNINGLILTGRGIFDGKGGDAWEKNKGGNKGDNQRMPASIQFSNTNDVVIRGITSVDSKGFHFFINCCDNFRIFNIKLLAPDWSPNTDGIHMSKSSRVKVSKSIIGTGDDCFSMVQGCSKISISKVFCGPGHGISIGSLGHYPGEGDVAGIAVKNCTLTGTDNGVRIKTYRNTEPSKATGVIFQDIVMTQVRNPIVINQEYGTRDGSEASEVSIKDVFFTNIRGTTLTKDAVNLVCSSKHPCESVHLNNIDLKYEGPENKHPFISICKNTKPIYVGTQNPPPCP